MRYTSALLTAVGAAILIVQMGRTINDVSAVDRYTSTGILCWGVHLLGLGLLAARPHLFTALIAGTLLGVAVLVSTHIFVSTFPLFRANSTLVADSIEDNTVVGLLLGNALLHAAPFYTAMLTLLWWGTTIKTLLPSKSWRCLLITLYHLVFVAILLGTVLGTSVKHTYAIPGVSDATIEAALAAVGIGVALTLLPAAALLLY